MTVDQQLVMHMMEPKNYGHMDNSDAYGFGKNPQNGEKVVIYLRIGKDEEEPYIDDIKFQAIGCSTTVVAGSMLTDEAKGLNLSGAKNLVDATLRLLVKLPPEDAACSEMVALAILAAVETYEKRMSEPDFPPITYKIKSDCTPKEEENESSND